MQKIQTKDYLSLFLKLILFAFLFLAFLLLTDLCFGSAPENGTITISSATYTTITADYEPREVYLGDPTTIIPIFYKIDSSTTNIPTEGFWIPAGQGQGIQFNGVIHLQLGAGESDVTIRKMIIK